MILAGEVQVDGQRVEKAGMPVAEDASIKIISRVQKFVSRGGTKLDGAMEDFAIEPAGYVWLGNGSWDGGLAQLLLPDGAQRVYRLHGNGRKVDWKMLDEPRVDSRIGEVRVTQPREP